QYEDLGCIGEGTYGVVIKCRHRETGQLVAIKQFKESDDDEQVQKTVEREVRILKALAHVNVVSLLDVFCARGRVHLVFEYVERTVLDCLKMQPRGLGDAPTRRIMWQLVKAVEYLHTQKVPLMHRDIKPENMLVSGAGLLKLCDFGFARPCAGAGGRAELSDYVATRWYRSPELLVGDRCYGPAVDVWAIGCMAVEMHTGDPLFPGESDVDQLWLILKGMGSLTPTHSHLLSRNPYFTGMRQPAVWEMEPLEVRYRKFDLPLLQFLKACLHPNPEKRASCSELLRLPYLANVEASFGAEFLGAEVGTCLLLITCHRPAVPPAEHHASLRVTYQHTTWYNC
ncbi:Pkinase-domain-containing protein, partial [Coccomyxa subellipsoidea C-169]